MTTHAAYFGLNNAEVNEKLVQYGYNELPSSKRPGIIHMLLNIVREPMFLLLLTCGALYFFLGDVEETLMLLGFVFIIIGITLYQEQRTEKALEALRDLSSPRALVIRNGIQIRIAGREVVPDDIILLSEGDRVPADAVILSTTNLNIDESLLTGESVPVLKKAWDGKKKLSQPGGDGLPFVFSGTMVVKGQAIAKVITTGAHTEIGKIGKAIQVLKPEDSNLQRQTRQIIKIFSIIGLILCLIVIITFGLTRSNWLQGLLAGITLAMSILPEEFPVIMTIFLAMGAWRISRRNVLTRRVPAVEMLGAATVLCVDKTGTLTMNHMTVTKIMLDGQIYGVKTEQASIAENLHRIIEYSILASPADPFDPMEKAIKELGTRTLVDTEHLHTDWKLLHEYSLSEKLLAMSRVWQSKNGEEYIIAAKGAPEAIADLCHMDANQLALLHQQINQMTQQGLRVIGIAQTRFKSANLPNEQHDFDFEFLGLFGLSDPVRPGVTEAVAECYSAGIRVIMITGDYPGTAVNIARQIGMKPLDQVITGQELNNMQNVELQQRIRTSCIFARIIPEQKLRIVNALKANGEIVAMTGDGVNDAPALKSAHIGIAMGGRGTDVARESAALVLLDDNFSSIVAAVRLGRRIFDNLKKAMLYTFAVHIPIAGMSLLPVLFKWPLALLPAHIVFLELIIDPSCSIAFEMEEEENAIMQRKPRNTLDHLFNRKTIFMGLVQGLFILVVAASVYSLSLYFGIDENKARTLSFANIMIGNLGLIFSNRSWTRSIFKTMQVPNLAQWWVTAGALFFLILSIRLPFLQNLFYFAPLKNWELGLCLLTGILVIILSEALKHNSKLTHALTT